MPDESRNAPFDLVPEQGEPQLRNRGSGLRPVERSLVEDLGLEALGVKVDRTHVVTDGHGATNVPGLYAIGDVAGPPWLAHKASHEGVHCVEHLAGLKPTNIESPIPSCTYSTPQVASVGLTEAQAKEQGREPKVGRFPFRVNGNALIVSVLIVNAWCAQTVPDRPLRSATAG